GDTLLASLLGEAASARRAVDLSEIYSSAQNDAIRARIRAGADVAAGRDLAVTSSESGTLSVLSGGFAGGVVGGAAAIAVVKRGTTVETLIGNDVRLTAASSVTISSIA